MDEYSSISVIDQKMAEMRIKNLELLKRHQEIEEDRQFAVRLGATTVIETMRGSTKNRPRITTNQQNSQEIQHERIHRPPIRRKFENDRNDNQPQRAQRVDYNRLKRERAQEINNQKLNINSINPELQEYAYPFHYQSENNNDADEPAHAKKLVIVNNKADKIGSGRFSQQQRTQEQGQRKRDERMRRCTIQNNGHTGEANEFHLDVPSMPIWQNGPMHVQFIPTNLNNHLINTSGDQMDQSAYIHNFVYSPPAQTTSFNGNGTVYFTHPSSSSASQSSQQTHFHQYHSPRTFENSNRSQFHVPPFQSSPIFQSPPPSSQPLLSSNEMTSTDIPFCFRHHDNKFSQQRPMSGDFERLHNSHHSSSTRFQLRPQSFYDFSSNNNNNNNNFSRSSNNNRYQRNHNNNNNNNTSLPLSAYMNTDNSLDENENLNNHWGTTHQRRRSTQQRTYHQDKHQFPLSSYDPRQYGFDNNCQRRNDFNNRSNTNRRNTNNNHQQNKIDKNSNDIDLIEEWWEDNSTELIGTNPSILDYNSKTITTVDDSGNSSLSTSMNLKETTLDDFVNPPSDVSTTDSNIIESLDKLQQELKLEEAVDERLASNELNKESTTYDTAHFMQWAKEKFREELAGRLTAQEIEQHDAVTSDDDQLPTDNKEKFDTLEDDLNEKLTIDENLSKSIVVE